MSDPNQWQFVLDQRQRIKGPILEVGSKDYGGSTRHDFRTSFPGIPYLGVDIQPGRGVDTVCDLANPSQPLAKGVFQTVICLSVLEHCKQPFKMAEAIDRLLAPSGLLFLSVPMVWRIHKMPDDYWRFTPSGVRALFPGFKEVPVASYCTTKTPGRRWPLGTTLMAPKVIPPPGSPKQATSFFPLLLNMLMEKR
jgi:SAM-dependent methyltransferase